jgi:hypothetical protein
MVLRSSKIEFLKPAFVGFFLPDEVELKTES